MRTPKAPGKLTEEVYPTFYFMLPRLPSLLSQKPLSQSQFSTSLVLIKEKDKRKKWFEKILNILTEEKRRSFTTSFQKVLTEIGQLNLLSKHKSKHKLTDQY